MPEPTLDPVLRKRLYIRYKQRAYRQKIVSEIEALQAEAAVLERHVARLTAKKQLLSWKDVAVGLKDDVVIARRSTTTLEAKRKAYLDVISAMAKWIAIQKGIQTPPSLRPTWRNVTLVSNATSRKLGFDWITKNVHFHTDKMLETFKFPSPMAPKSLLDFYVDAADAECLQYVLRCQQDLPIPLEYVVPAIRDNVVSFLIGALWNYEDREMQENFTEPLDMELLQEPDDRMRYTRNVLSGEESIYYLTREFRTPNRVTFVGQNIHEDELLPKSQRQCNRNFWFVLDRLGPAMTRLRVLYTTSHYFTANGYVSLDDEARYWGCDLSTTHDTKKAAVFHRHATDVGTEFARLGAQQIALGFGG
ncbi:hypothetical protein, variant [Saprolegnia diclina VS20]|uniref:Uncharacterized protein n=1 Tax=Saprolegnia diclina (strain VS20) TaxID=1156394 RepID=T0RIR8_SAPDV|nr:hypothetical protein SDRG_10012 [Saprolegnia diclina VS20]XP_008614205.1 hypothetical protein, variant [Saprolegnia diclina VS20]EQC32263.1 hypothetical protein SDRG_10012 [Saprolegnia diclina VS20]EQC32264.1 hypothetical protein, variant [Saprolegnia diclina VS20]|eukprot:XP_008614204.1 hypothetical protein SDRG_10012 [Saprolegnia diclina VS20]